MKLMLLDANSLINRAFYAIRLLTNSKGEYTNAIYGFLSVYCRLIEDEAPDGVCACFDLKGPTFRHLAYEDYKAGRRPMPSELAPQFDSIRRLLQTLHVPCLDLPGYEADDLLGTMSQLCEDAGDECVVVTGDRDSLQLIGTHTKVRLITTSKGQSIQTVYDEAAFLDNFGVTPHQYIDVKALMGDSSDNIPGVAGIGEKTAFGLIAGFGSLEALYAWLDAQEAGEKSEPPTPVKPAAYAKLLAGRESAAMSRRLAEIDRHAPLSFTPAEGRLTRYDPEALDALLHGWELRSFYPRVRSGKGFLPPALLVEEAAAAGAVAAEEIAPLLPLTDPVPVLEKPGTLYLLMEDAVLLRKNGKNYRLSDEAAQDPAVWEKLCASEVVLHDAKTAMVRAAKLPGAPRFAHVLYDTALAAYLLTPTATDFSLDAVAAAQLDRVLPTAEPASIEELAEHNGDAAAVARLAALEQLHQLLPGKLEGFGMTKLYAEIELPLTQVLADMEQVGAAVDAAALAAYSRELGVRIAQLEADMEACTDAHINWNSPKQLGELLFETLALPGGKKTRTGYSTDVDVLKGMLTTHPVVGMVLEYRQLTKLKNTYADGLPKFIGADGRIHSHFQQMVTATGRLSSTDPNLQNIPVRNALGAELRRMFVAAPGCVLVDADYSQIELRLLAHIAQDRNMLEGFRQGADIHRHTAATVAGIPDEAVTPELRSRAKAVNFGIVYGISDFSLSQQLGISRAAAKSYMEAYFASYPGVAAYMERIREQAKADGYVTTLFGRRRALPELASSNRNLRAFGERVALNTPIQGTAADIMKIAMLRVCRRLAQEQLRARLILQVHDELILEAPAEEAETVQKLVREEMEAAAQLDVALLAETGAGENWYAAKA